jgi:hypothetical protein
MTPHRLTPIALCLAVFLTGCGPKDVRGAKLKGQVLLNGQPLKPLPGEKVWVTFERTEPWGGNKAIVSSGTLQKDGSFLIEGQEKNGTPAGKYTVTLHGEFSREDGENRFQSLFPGGQSPFTADVTADAEQAFIIDLGAKTITKQ